MNLYKQTILTLLLLYFVNYVSCHKAPTAPNTGILTGTVLLEGEQDYTGITVALYKLAELDTTILPCLRQAGATTANTHLPAVFLAGLPASF